MPGEETSGQIQAFQPRDGVENCVLNWRKQGAKSALYACNCFPGFSLIFSTFLTVYFFDIQEDLSKSVFVTVIS